MPSARIIIRKNLSTTEPCLETERIRLDLIEFAYKLLRCQDEFIEMFVVMKQNVDLIFTNIPYTIFYSFIMSIDLCNIIFLYTKIILILDIFKKQYTYVAQVFSSLAPLIKTVGLTVDNLINQYINMSNNRRRHRYMVDKNRQLGTTHRERQILSYDMFWKSVLQYTYRML